MAILIRPMTLVVRATSTIAPLAALMRVAVERADREQPISNLRPMTEVLARSLAHRRLLLTIMIGFRPGRFLSGDYRDLFRRIVFSCTAHR